MSPKPKKASRKLLANAPAAGLHRILFELKQLRLKAGIPQVEASLTLGYGHSQVARAETAMNKASIDFVDDYASLFGLELRLCPKNSPKTVEG